jgi:putative endonuclease
MILEIHTACQELCSLIFSAPTYEKHLKKLFAGKLHSLIFATLQGGLAQLARAFAWHAKGHRFDSGNLHPKSGKCRAFFMPAFVYIIYSQQLNKFYVGYSVDLIKRLSEHNAGMSAFTAKASDWVLKYSESFPDRESAIKREKEIKSKKSRKYIEWLISSAG